VSTKANALLSCLERSDALVRLACLKAIGRVMKPLAQALQRKAGDPLRALQLIDETTSILQKIRSGDGSSLSFSGIFQKTTGMADASALLYRNHGFLLVDRYTEQQLLLKTAMKTIIVSMFLMLLLMLY